LGLTPWEFWRCTPSELQDIAEGKREQEEAEWERAAWMTAYLLQPHSKKGKKITPRQLLGRGFYKRKAEETKEAAMDKRKAEETKEAAMAEYKRVQELKAADGADDE
jgi:hypothetical protein